MGKPVLGILGTWPFVASLAVLLANDLYLKAACSSYLTGKLSDFAGIFLVAALAFVLFPRRAALAGSAIAALFLWWKSPASDGFIEAVRHAGFAFGRVVDYSDLAALVMLLPAAHVASHPTRFRLGGERLRRVIAIPIACLATFAVMGTSIVPPRDTFRIRDAGDAATFDAELAAGIVKRVAEGRSLACVECRQPASRARYQGNDTTIEYEIRGGREIAFTVSVFPGLFFPSNAEGKFDAIKADLKREFTGTGMSLEFIEPLLRPEERYRR
jgi:hypothetical protein